VRLCGAGACMFVRVHGCVVVLAALPAGPTCRCCMRAKPRAAPPSLVCRCDEAEEAGLKSALVGEGDSRTVVIYKEGWSPPELQAAEVLRSACVCVCMFVPARSVCMCMCL
jgi:hypothetical protein